MNYQPLDIIKNAIKNNKLSHAYLFYGDNGVDIENTSQEAIKMIIESNGIKLNSSDLKQINYFDLQIVEPNNENLITKELVDSAINKLFESSLSPNAIKVLYIKNIDLGNKHSLNRLLKFIEEPTNNLVIVMNTNHFNNVISTIKSRSQNIYIRRESIKRKIDLMKDINKEHASIFANIYANVNQLKNIDTSDFDKTYNKIIDAFQNGLKNKFSFKEDINNIWNKNNSDFVLNIFQFFFYQLMTEIDSENPLFPNQDELIIEYKKKNIDCYKIQLIIEKTKQDLKRYANFNLQKSNFLIKIEQELK